ncbi:hypothetical protein BKA83DRAFT_4169449 [Pisolithus microcarpus]|nr:hypothetical protein BKA83DRAFT_4169449 [Pisolithus microcarpus]
MTSSCSISAESSSSLFGKFGLLRHEPQGTHKIHYKESCDWDFVLETPRSIDISLAIPHYRARHQPIDQRLRLFVAGECSPIKLKICRPVPRSKFYLEVQATASNVTIWLPSDFRGHISHSGKASFSAGFINRMMANIRLNEKGDGKWTGDEVFVQTEGTVTFRMWDVHTNAPENVHKETLKRLFNCSKNTCEARIDWDFLLDD